MTYLLCSGFGFDNGYWKNLIPLLDGEYEFFDSSFEASERRDYVGIGHSLGFLKLNNSGIKFRISAAVNHLVIVFCKKI